MKDIMKKRWFFPMAAVFFLCVIALGAQLSYGAYVRRSYIKAVIATNETEKLFGSNLLYGVKNQPDDPDGDAWQSVYPFTVADAEQDTIMIPIKIYNYLTEDQDRVNQLDVSYTIRFKVLGNPETADGTLSGYAINGHAVGQTDTVYYLGENGLTTEAAQAARQALPGRLPNLNEYRITMPGGDLGKVSIAVIASRVSNDGQGGDFGTDLLYLAARVVPSLASSVQTATVTGSFDGQDGLPADYAAYNYTIELTGSSAAVVLRWNPDLLEIDPFFKAKYGARPENGQVVFNMEPGFAKIQFYRSGNAVAEDWDSLGVCVSER